MLVPRLIANEVLSAELTIVVVKLLFLEKVEICLVVSNSYALYEM